MYDPDLAVGSCCQCARVAADRSLQTSGTNASGDAPLVGTDVIDEECERNGIKRQRYVDDGWDPFVRSGEYFGDDDNEDDEVDGADDQHRA